MGKFISIIIPAYNYSHFLRQCINSVFKQDFPADQREIIVVDDGSTDNTQDVLLEFKQEIRSFRQTNQGQAAAILKGLQMARGDLIAFLDPDDEWYESKLTRTSAEFHDPETAMVQHQMDIQEDGRKSRRKLQSGLSSGWIREEALSYRFHFMPMSALVFRKSALDRVLPLPLDFRTGGCDSYLAITTALFSRISAIQEPLGLYRIHERNAFTDNFSADSLRVQLRVEEELYRRAVQMANSFGVNHPKGFERIWFAEFPVSRKMDLAHQEHDFFSIPNLYWKYLKSYALPEYGLGLRFAKRALHMGVYGLLPPKLYKKLRFLLTASAVEKSSSK